MAPGKFCIPPKASYNLRERMYQLQRYTLRPALRSVIACLFCPRLLLEIDRSPLD